jgi:hypothetical protein
LGFWFFVKAIIKSEIFILVPKLPAWERYFPAKLQLRLQREGKKKLFFAPPQLHEKQAINADYSHLG